MGEIKDAYPFSSNVHVSDYSNCFEIISRYDQDLHLTAIAADIKYLLSSFMFFGCYIIIYIFIVAGHAWM